MQWVFVSTGGGGTNLVGKFTQSVRRIVQDVKDEGTASEYHARFLQPVWWI